MDTVGLLAQDPTLLLAIFAVLGEQRPTGRVDLDGRVIARPVGLHGSVDTTIADAIELAADTHRARGGKVVEIEFGGASALSQAGREILRYEFFRQHGGPILSRSDRVGRDVHGFVEVAAGVSSSVYEEALALVSEHRGRWFRQLQGIDALLLPAVPGLAPRLEDEHTEVNGKWVPYGPAGAELRMWANTIGLPAIAIPVPRTGGLPASIQLAGHPHADSFLLALASSLGSALAERPASA
jgi:Asp-tRNA(Asn)/Glu-tRNA(Gln) amidotransferase A subunit family amidase